MVFDRIKWVLKPIGIGVGLGLLTFLLSGDSGVSIGLGILVIYLESLKAKG